MKENPMELDHLLSDTAPVADPTPAALAAGRAALEGTFDELAQRRRKRVRRSTLAGLVATAAAAAVILPSISVTGAKPAATASAASVVLRQAGSAAGAQPGGWADAEYWHSVSTYHQGSGPQTRREIWIGHHQIGVLKDGGVNSGILPLEVGLFPAGGTGLTWDQLYALPTSAGPLEAKLRSGIDGAGSDDDSELFVIVGDLLRESPASPALRKALYEVAANVPGVELVGTVQDADGRQGVEVKRGDQAYIVDTYDGRLLQESQGAAGPISENPNGGNWTATYEQQGPTTTAPAPTATDPKKG
jgi:hypothetical protein